MINIKNLCRFYKTGDLSVKAVDHIDLEIKKGEFSVLSGPSGSGKTTLLNLIGGIDIPNSGEIFLDEVSLHDKTESELTNIRLTKIGFVFQAYNLLPVLTVYENIQLILEVLKDI